MQLKIKKTFLAIIILFLLTSCLGKKNSKVAGSGNGIKDSINTEINKIYRQGFFNGFAVSIVSENGTLYQNGFGFSDVSTNRRYTDHTIQNIASVSKTLVGIALLKAQELGKLNLDSPVEKYLPFKVINPYYPQDKITIRQLATHTSTITDNEYYLSKNYVLRPGQDLKDAKLNFDGEQTFIAHDSIVSLGSFLENILSSKGKWYQESSFLHNKPGALYMYSNTGTSLAAYIIEQATGISFSAFTDQYILKPLKMTASGWQFDKIDFSKFSRLYENPATALPYYETISYPDGGFITSVNDLSIFLAELIRGYSGKGIILSKESYKEYFKPQLTASNFLDRNVRNPYSESYNVGIFIGFGYTGYIGHTGGDPGVLSMMYFDPETNLGRIMIFNTNFSDKAGNDAFYSIWNILEQYQSRI